MSETMQMWTEIGFNLSYLVVIWGLVGAMWVQREMVPPEQWGLARLFIGGLCPAGAGGYGPCGLSRLGVCPGRSRSDGFSSWPRAGAGGVRRAGHGRDGDLLLRADAGYLATALRQALWLVGSACCCLGWRPCDWC